MTTNQTQTSKLLILGGTPQFDQSAAAALSAHYELVIVRSIEEALDYLRHHNVDAVLSGSADFLPLERAMVSQQSAALLNTMGQGVCIIDEGRRVIWQNRSMAEVSPAVVEQVRAHAEKAIAQFRASELGPPGSPGRMRRFTAQDEGRFYEMTVSPLTDSADPARLSQVAVVIWDVSASRRLQQKLDAIDQAGQELVRLEAESLAKLNVQQRLRLLEERIIRYTRGLLNFENFGIWLLDRQTQRLQLVLSDGFPQWVADLEIYASAEGNGISGYVAATGQSYICSDTSRDVRYIMGIEKARSSLTVPLRLQDAVIGVLNVESPRPGDFGEDDRQFAEIFGRYIALALNILDLLVVERYTSVGKIANNVAGEIEEPLRDIVSQASSLIEENIGNDDLRTRLHGIIDHVTAIRQTVKQVAQAPTTILGRRNIRNVRRDPGMAAKRVLVADDDATILSDLTELLKRYGCVVETAKDGAEATAMVRSRDYDLILSDIRMPHATGYDIFAAARSRSAKTPVILMTGFGYDPNHSIFRAKQEGAFGVLFKPFKVDQVLDLVRKALTPAQGS